MSSDDQTFENFQVQVKTSRLILKALVEADVSPVYLSWFDNSDVKSFTVAGKSAHNIESLKSFVKEKRISSDALLFGIFSSETGAHLGNVKFEPIDLNRSCAVMGILLGESSRGKGIAGEAILAGSQFLKNKFGITTIELAVSPKNLAAITAYEKIGFFRIEKGVFVESIEHSMGMQLSL